MENKRQTEAFFRASVRRKAKRILAMMLVVIMVNFVIGNGSIISANGNNYNISTGDLTIKSSNLSTYNNTVITGTSSSNMITIDGVTANLTISDMNLNIESSTTTTYGWYSAIKLTNGATLNLTIKGTNTLTGGTNNASINVPGGCSLVVTKDSTGTLTATAGGGSAGIGANFGGNRDDNIQTVGSITINGGTVKAYGKGVGAGIGGTMFGKTGKIVINGGTVYAEGGGGTLSNNLFSAACGAGIGGGCVGFVENITIIGGNVTAVGGNYHMSYSNFHDHPGAGIGCGSINGHTLDEKYTCGTISITGGVVSAISGNNNAVNAIGYGLEPNFDISGDDYIGSVTISDSASVNTNGGAIHPLSNIGSLNMYKLAMTIYDARLAKTIEGATIKVNGKTYLSDIKVNENYVGSIYCSLILCNAVLKGEQTVEISAGGYSWSTIVNFTENKFDYNAVIGSKLYPVYLWFYDNAIVSDISGVSLSVKQNGNLLNSNAAEGMVQLVCDKTITKYKAGVGKMTAYMPTGSSELTAKVPGVNGGNAITVSGKTVKASLDGTIIILWDKGTTTQLSSTLDLSYGNITFADNGGKLDITYTPLNGGVATTVTGQYYQNEYEIIQSSSTVTTNKIIFQNTTNFVNVKMNNVNMKSTDKAIDLQNAKAKLSLSGTNIIDCGGGGTNDSDVRYYIGIHAASGSELTIDGSGSLEVKNPSYYGVGIGGYYNYSGGVREGAGMIRIQGGTLNVSGKKGAAIGSSYFYNGNDFGSIYITGGTVDASSNYGGAAIGGSDSGKPANVYITGGKVTAKIVAYYGGAAIGSGSYGVSGGKVVISGGYIEATATGSANISAIGGGYKGGCPDITISGGTIKASGSVASIGTAKDGIGGSLKITGGTICKLNNEKPTINLTPTTDGTTPVYYTTADVSGMYGNNAAVNNASITGSGYDFTDVKTDANGILHLYLPASATGMEKKASFNNVNYSGIITLAGNNVLKKFPNLKLENTVSGKVFDDTPISHSTVKGDLFAWDSAVALSFTYFTDNTGTKTINANSGAATEGAAPKNAGTYYLKATLAENGEYLGAETDYIPFTINKKESTVTVNGGTGTGAYEEGKTVDITAIIPSGKQFKNWTSGDVTLTSSTSINTTFTMPAKAVSVTANIVEAGKLHTVNYDGNGNIGGNVPTDANSYLQNETVNVLDEENIIKNGYIFNGWNTKQDGTGTSYKPSGTFVMGAENITLYAQWREGTRYEAENATIFGASIESNNEGASGKSQVGSINEIGRYVEFPSIPAYSKVLVRYASNAPGKISVYLDNNIINKLTFTSTGDWSGVGKYKDLNFELNSSKGGALKFEYDLGDVGALNIDYIEIVKNNSIIKANTENTEKGTVNVTNAVALGENNYKNEDGKEVTLTAVPKEGYNFDGWYDAIDKKVSNRPAWSFKVTEYGSYTAKFVLMPKAALTVSTVGTGNISINGGTQITNKIETYSLGTVVTLTAIDSENSPFEYWVDNNGRVISTSKTYNLYLGSDTTIKAMFNTKTASTHLVTFKNGITGDIIQKSYAAEGETVTALANPYMYGYTFNGWDKTAEDIKAAIKDIVVNALFKKNEVKYTVTVSGGTINGGATSGQYDIKEFITVTASAAEIGKKFSHWVDSKGNIVCYDATYKFYVTAGIQLTAVYVTEDSKVEQKASIVLNATPNQDTKKIAFLTTRNVPVGCTIISHGVILTNNSETAASADTFILGAADILKATSKDNSLLGTYIITKGNVATGAIWYGRGYLIYKDTNGNVVTVYSSIESGTIN